MAEPGQHPHGGDRVALSLQAHGVRINEHPQVELSMVSGASQPSAYGIVVWSPANPGRSRTVA